MTLRSRAVDALFTGLEGIASLYDFVRGLRRAGEPKPSQPLPFKSVRHQQEQIRSATRRDAMRPPPR